MPQQSPQNASSASAPRFRQIVNHLRDEIVTGRLPEHAALPSERTVAERHGVSRMTARRALEAIEAEGLVYSEDRKGRFVSPRRLNYNVSSMANFITDAEAEGHHVEIEPVHSAKIRADAQLAGILSVDTGDALIKTARLFRNQGHATFLETEHVVIERAARLLGGAEPLTDQRYSPLGHGADISIRMRALQPDEAGLLGLAPHQAGIELEHLVRDEAGVPFCFSRQIWRGELAQFSAKSIVNR